MAILNNSNAISAGGYDVNNSLRLRSSASAYLNRTPASAGNRKTWTWSAWVKRGTLGSFQTLFCAGASDAVSPYETRLRFNDTDTLVLTINGNGATGGSATTTAVFRDPSAWYHIVAYVDMASSGQGNKVRLYINGVLQTVTYTSLTTTDDTQVNNNVIHRISANSFALSGYFDGYMAEQYLIDGQALTPSSFGATDATTGVWKPKAYTGTYGTNGYYLKFSDIATTSGSNAGLGKDFSGNTNYWTTNNISVTSGQTYDAMIDSPTNTSETVANYATFSGTNLGTYANATITEAGLRVSVSAGGTPDGGKAYAPFGMSDGSGKWYFEMTCVDPGAGNQRLCFGIVNITTNPNAVAITNGYYASASGAHGNYNIGTFTTNDVLQVAYDSGTNKLWFGKNNTWYNSGNPAAGTTPLVTVTSGITYAPFSTYASSGQGPGIGAWNFGQRPFAYTPPTGFNRLNTYNLPDSTIKKGNNVMDATLYTGNGSTQTITNATGFRPDLVWIKSRSNARDHAVADSVRGVLRDVASNTTAAETTNTNYLTAFNSNGFTIGDLFKINASGNTFVAWQWQAGSSTVTNTSGTISSQVRANTTTGFSIVTYTGNGTLGATVGHGLGVAPRVILIKSRSILENWAGYFAVLGNGVTINLNATTGAGGSSEWNSTTPTSTVFTIGNGSGNNQNNATYVAYCWSEITGFSRFGSYTGNGSADGPFVFTNFSPRFVIIKSSSIAGEWAMYDINRGIYNPNGAAGGRLQANTANAETGNDSAQYIDFLSNGFKIRNISGFDNQSGATYVYMAFASNPFKNSNAF